MTTIVSGEPVDPKRRRTLKLLIIIRTFVLLLVFLLTIVLAVMVGIFITRIHHLKQEIKTKNMDIINEQTKNNNSTQQMQRLTKQLRYLKYARRELNLILHLTNH
jgi:cell division protein FtsL